MEKERGELLCHGMTGSPTDTIKGQKETFLIWLFLSSIIVFLFVLTITGSNLFAQVMLGLLSILFLWATFFITYGFDIYGVYENGISFGYPGFRDKRKGCSFQRYEEITRIYYGRTKSAKGHTNYLRIVGLTRPDRKRSGDIICEKLYKNDFFDRLWNELARNCYDAEWVDINRWGVSGEFSFPFCSYCSSPLTYVPDYERWYCYECEGYAPEE